VLFLSGYVFSKIEIAGGLVPGVIRVHREWLPVEGRTGIPIVRCEITPRVSNLKAKLFSGFISSIITLTLLHEEIL
jgi:hypothetical protein